VSDQSAASPEPAPEQPSRYDRSFGGLLAAMVVTVLFVAAYVGFRALTREQPDVQPEVDYLSCVAYLQEADVSIAYPADLPAGWRATSINFERGTPPSWRIGLLTADDDFIGVVQEQTDVQEVLKDYVDSAPTEGEDATPENRLGAATWQTWSDPGGDHALSAVPESGPLAGQTVVVYGSAPLGDQEALLARLSLDAVSSGASATDCDTDSL
jgi:hypothetical protein